MQKEGFIPLAAVCFFSPQVLISIDMTAINVKLKAVIHHPTQTFPQVQVQPPSSHVWPAADKRAFFFYYLSDSSAKYCNARAKKRKSESVTSAEPG